MRRVSAVGAHVTALTPAGTRGTSSPASTRALRRSFRYFRPVTASFVDPQSSDADVMVTSRKRPGPQGTLSVRCSAMADAPLLPLRERFAERFLRCASGLAGFGIGIAFFVKSRVGVPPWDVFHQGIARITDLPLGTNIIIVSFFVLILWVPLRIRPGLGTLMNAVEIGFVENIAQSAIPDSSSIAVRILYVILGMCAISAGSGLYIGAQFGPGPRDGLMLGLNKRYGISVRLARTLVEVVVMLVGVALGGTVGVGTFVFALGIGPMVQVTLRLFRMSERDRLAAEGEALEA